jgi:hypothetical protein
MRRVIRRERGEAFTIDLEQFQMSCAIRATKVGRLMITVEQKRIVIMMLNEPQQTTQKLGKLNCDQVGSETKVTHSKCGAR